MLGRDKKKSLILTKHKVRKAQDFPLAFLSKVVDPAFMFELQKPKQASELMGRFLKNNIFIFENSLPGKAQKVPSWVPGSVPPEEAAISSRNGEG